MRQFLPGSFVTYEDMTPCLKRSNHAESDVGYR